jgi:hypothetical protein
MIHAIALTSAITLSINAPPVIRRTAPVVTRRATRSSSLETATPNRVRLYAMHGFVGALPTGYRFPLVLRTGRVLEVDASYAIPRGLAGQLIRGRPVVVNGYFDQSGVLHAANVENTELLPAYWAPDAPLTDPHSRTKADIRTATPRPQ